MCLYRNISAIWPAFLLSAGLKRHDIFPSLFQSPSPVRKVIKVSSLLHFRILHSPLVQGLWLSHDSHGLGFCFCRVSMRTYLLFILPDAIRFADSSHSSSLVTQVLEQSMWPTSQAAVAFSLREKGSAVPTIQDLNNWCWGTFSVTCHHPCCTICNSPAHLAVFRELFLCEYICCAPVYLTHS